MIFAASQCSAEVVRINLTSGESDTVFHTIVGVLGTDEFRKATIIGDYFAASSPRRGQTTHRILVINWRTETFAFLRCPRSLEAGPALIPGHITLTFSGHISYDEQVVSIWPLASFAWLPIVQTPAFAHFSTDMETQPPLASTRIRLGFHGARHPPRVELSVLQNPLRHGTYKVILYTTYRRSENEPHDEPRPALPGTEGPILPRLESDLRCFSLCLPTLNLPVELRQLSTAPARLFLREPCVSYSGHCIIPRMLSIVVAEVCSTCEAVEWLNSWEVEPRGQRACVALSLAPYGGVVATLGYINAKVTHFL
ncbi:hypothetical protein C8R46DRAFT_375808 [Mycena filopes]|nr:hypothetical protein C8R46DRAFT_375808 [Mycena filopes]